MTERYYKNTLFYEVGIPGNIVSSIYPLVLFIFSVNGLPGRSGLPQYQFIDFRRNLAIWVPCFMQRFSTG